MLVSLQSLKTTEAINNGLCGDRTKWYTDKIILDKMVWTEWYGQNGMDKMVRTKWYNFIFCVHFNSIEFNIYLVTKSHK